MLSKMLIPVFLLLSPLLVVAETEVTKLPQMVIGRWTVTTVIDGINAYSNLEFKTDKSVHFNLTLSGSDGAYNYKSYGTWKIKGKAILMEITFSDSKNYLHVGDKLVYNVIHIDQKTLKYTDGHGGKVTYQRQ